MSKIKISPQELKTLLTGVFNIQFTPIKSATEIDKKALADHTNFIIEGGLVNGKGVTVIGGSNGEGFSLSDQEYRDLIDVVVDTAASRVPVIVGCVRPGTRPVIELAKYAEEAGASGLMILAPHYYPNPSHDLIYEHFKSLADETNIGIIVYNNPLVTGIDIPIELVERLADIDNIVGLKETTSNMYRLRKVITRYKERFNINTNTYRWMMPLDYQLGAQGFNTYFGNADPGFAVRMHEIGASGDFDACHKLWSDMVELYDFCFSHGDMYKASALGKEMVRIVGLSMGDYERLPLVRPSKAERDILRDLMIKGGLTVK